jgi:hypothetical protein
LARRELTFYGSAMKKLMTIGTALALALTLSATGCKKKNEDAKTDTTTKKPEEKPVPAPAPAPTDPATNPSTNPTAGANTATDTAATIAATGVAECDEYLATVEKAAKCDKFAPAADGIKKAAEAWKTSIAGWGALDEAARKAAQAAAAATCKSASDGVKTTATSLGCVL